MSKYDFPPTSNDTRRIDELLQVYQTLMPKEKSAIYISTPMTSGLKYMNAYADLPPGTKLSDDQLKQFFNQNCQHARSVAALTRLHYPTSQVIDPTNISIDGWSQNDYLTFWRRVIIDHAYIIRFVNDWYYSNGCAYEFLVGALTNKVMIDEAENTISVYDGCRLIKRAYEEHLEFGYDNEFLLKTVASLEKFLHDEDGS